MFAQQFAEAFVAGLPPSPAWVDEDVVSERQLDTLLTRMCVASPAHATSLRVCVFAQSAEDELPGNPERRRQVTEELSRLVPCRWAGSPDGAPVAGLEGFTVRQLVEELMRRKRLAASGAVLDR